MHFQRIKETDKTIENMFINYCIDSKPYDFCHLPSRSMSIFKIKEYMEFLFNTCEVYLGMIDNQIKIFIAVERKDNATIIQFVFGTPFGFMSNVAMFRRFYKKVNPEIQKFSAQIMRKHKLDSFLKFITKKDPEMQINLDKQEITVLWNT